MVIVAGRESDGIPQLSKPLSSVGSKSPKVLREEFVVSSSLETQLLDTRLMLALVCGTAPVRRKKGRPHVELLESFASNVGECRRVAF
jgi:hypothetical protein